MKEGSLQRAQEVTIVHSHHHQEFDSVLASNVREFSLDSLIIPNLTCVTSSYHSPLFMAFRERERQGGGMAQLFLHYA